MLEAESKECLTACLRNAAWPPGSSTGADSLQVHNGTRAAGCHLGGVVEAVVQLAHGNLVAHGQLLLSGSRASLLAHLVPNLEVTWVHAVLSYDDLHPLLAA